MKIRRQDAPELLSRSYYWCWETIYHPSRQNNISLDCGQHQRAKSKMAAREPQIADGVWKGVYLKVFGCSRQLSLNNFLTRALLLQEKVATEGKKTKITGKLMKRK